jgi:glycosyltransferase involved in cell wall biosynthesis
MTTPRTLLWMPRTGVIHGGHRRQLEETAAALGNLGVIVETSFDPDPDLSAIDLVHGFGLNSDEVRVCRSVGLPVVESTIYWDRAYRYTGDGGHVTARQFAGRVRRAARLALASIRGGLPLVRESWSITREETRFNAAYSAVDMLLPNAEGEAASIVADLDVQTPYRFVPNAADPSRFAGSTGEFHDRGSVLCCARVEPHKNQLGLIRAMAGTGIPLVIAGAPHRHHNAYLERCRAEADANVTFTGWIPDDDLAALYRSARVHVLPSWFETTGLVSLEAALSGCNIVSTSRGHAREYFGDLAWYCDPADRRSIRDAVFAAWNAPPTPALRERILANYTWEHTARATVDAYLEVLARRSSPAGSTRTATSI